MSKSITKNTFFYVIYNVLNIIFPLVTGIYVARVLLPGDIGAVESAKNLVQYFVIFAFLGIPTYGIREIAKYKKCKKELDKVYSELMVINFISTCFFGLIYLVLILSIPMYNNQFALYILVGLLIFLNFFNNTWLYEGLEKFGFISLRNFIFKILSFVVLMVFVRGPEDFMWYAAISVVGTAGNYIVNMIESRKFVKFSLCGINLFRHLKSIMFLVVVNLAIEIYTLVDITMLGIMCKNENVAFYAYGMKIFRILQGVSSSLATVVTPRLAEYYKENKINDFNKLISKALKVLLICIVPAIIGTWFVANFIVTSFYGEQYETSAIVLKILTCSLLVSPIGYLLGSRVMLVTGNEKKMVAPVACGAIINIICNLIFIRIWSEIGAAFASVISEIIVMVVYLWLSHRKFKLISVGRTIANITISSTLMLLFLYVISRLDIGQLEKCVIQIFGSVIIYCVSMLMLKEQVLLDFLRKITRSTNG